MTGRLYPVPEKLRAAWAVIQAGLSFPSFWQNWHDGRPDGPDAAGYAKVMLDQLTWWATALRRARARAQVPYPGA